MPPGNIIFCDNPKKIRELLKTPLSAGDIVLLEGRLPENLISLF
jgi:hypothetical protein